MDNNITLAKMKLFCYYLNGKLSLEALRGGLLLIETNYTSLVKIKTSEVKLIIKIVSIVGYVKNDMRQIILIKPK